MATIKKYNGSTWENTTARKYETKSEIIVPPTTIYSDGTAITAYTLKGNTVQNGTPTPSNPVDVNGVGVRTENLFDADRWYGAYKQADGTYQTNRNTWYSLVAKPFTNDDIGKSFCFAADVVPSSGNARFAAVINGVQINGQYIGNRCEVSFTVQTIDDKIIFDYGSGSTTITTVSNIMLNTGSTVLPYEPYGYKIPISNGQQTIDIYIGDLPLLKSLDGTAFDEISNGTLTRRVDSDGSVLPTPTTTQITTPSIPTIEGANSITVDTAVQPSEFTATWTGWHNANVKEWDGSEWQ